jgi:hypothetical protein
MKNRWYVYHSQSWVVYDVVLPCFTYMISSWNARDWSSVPCQIYLQNNRLVSLAGLRTFKFLKAPKCSELLKTTADRYSVYPGPFPQSAREGFFNHWTLPFWSSRCDPGFLKSSKIREFGWNPSALTSLREVLLASGNQLRNLDKQLGLLSRRPRGTKTVTVSWWFHDSNDL